MVISRDILVSCPGLENENKPLHKGYNVGCFKWSFFRIFEYCFLFVVAIFDQVYDVEARSDLC